MSTGRDVQRKIESVWTDAEERNRVRRALDKYGGESTEAGRARVQLAILKVANGSVCKVEEWVEVAEQDYRDVVAAAEYPEESLSVWAVRPGLSAAEKTRLAEIRARDRQQYVEWFNS